MVWKCHRCNQKNRDSYRLCFQCETKKYICSKCGAVDYNIEEGERANLWERFKYWLGVIERDKGMSVRDGYCVETRMTPKNMDYFYETPN